LTAEDFLNHLPRTRCDGADGGEQMIQGAADQAIEPMRYGHVGDTRLDAACLLVRAIGDAIATGLFGF